MKVRMAAAMFCLPFAASGKPIETRAIDASREMTLTLATDAVTTVKFPEAIQGLSGLGIVDDSGVSGPTSASFGVRRQSPFLGLHALRPDAHGLLTVILADGQMYVMNLQTGTNPDVAITLVKGPGDGLQDGGLKPAPAIASAADVIKSRPRQNVSLYLGLIDRVREVSALKPVRPELYRGYTRQDVHYTSEGDLWKTAVSQVHCFPDDDAIVLIGTVTNKTALPLSFDTSAVTVRAGNELHAAKLTRVKQPIAPSEEVPFELLIQGDPEGLGPANLSPANEFRVYLPQAFGQVAGTWTPGKAAAVK